MNGFGLPVFLWGIKGKNGEDILDLLTPKYGKKNGEHVEFSEIIAQIIGNTREEDEVEELYILKGGDSKAEGMEKNSVRVLQGNVLPIGDVKYMKVENITEGGKPEDNRSKPKSETGKTELILSVNTKNIKNNFESAINKTPLMDKHVYEVPKENVKDVELSESRNINRDISGREVYGEKENNKKEDIRFLKEDLMPKRQPDSIKSEYKKEVFSLKDNFDKAKGNTSVEFSNEALNENREVREFIKKLPDGSGNANDGRVHTKVYVKSDYANEPIGGEVERPARKEDMRDVYHPHRVETGKGEVQQFENGAEVRQATDITEYETSNISKPKRVYLKTEDINIVLRVDKEKLSVSVRSENLVPDNISFLDKIRLAERLHTMGFDLEMLSVNGWQIISKSEKPLNYNKKGDRDRESIRHEIIGKKTSSVSDNTDFSLLL